jgi:hypothetical protein
LTEQEDGPPAIPNLARFTEEVLGWEAADLVDLANTTAIPSRYM